MAMRAQFGPTSPLSLATKAWYGKKMASIRGCAYSGMTNCRMAVAVRPILDGQYLNVCPHPSAATQRHCVPPFEWWETAESGRWFGD